MESTVKYEMETIINYNQEETDADIYTWDKSLQRHIETKLGVKPYEIQGGARSYKVPKKWIKKPRKPSQIKIDGARKRAMAGNFGFKKKAVVGDAQK
jgi:hypothetical protein